MPITCFKAARVAFTRRALSRDSFAVELPVNVPDQVREHFRVGIGLEIGIAILYQLLLQCLIVFDDAVVNERDFTGRIEMRVRIFVSHFSVRCPAGVTYPVRSRRGFLADQFCERRNSAGALARLDMVAVNDRDPGGIVAAIFKAAKPIEQNGGSLRSTYVTDDSAHI